MESSSQDFRFQLPSFFRCCLWCQTPGMALGLISKTPNLEGQLVMFLPKGSMARTLCLQGAQEYPPQCPTQNQCSRGSPRCPCTELDDKNTAPAEKQTLCPTHTREIKCSSRVDAGECRLQRHAPGLSIMSQKLGQRWRRMLGCVLMCAHPARCLRRLSSPKPHVLVSRVA